MTRQFENRSLIENLDLIIYYQKQDLENTVEEIITEITKIDAISEVLNLEGFD